MTSGSDIAMSALVGRFPGVAQGADPEPMLRLFHAPNSICSQKVRAVLHHLDIPYWSHLLNIFAGDTYDPAYVRVRMSGCSAAGLPLADRHLGTTSVASGGCDACVVPTLVESATGAVTVDSLRICLSLDAGQPDRPSLVPPDLVDRIMAELAVVDELPNYQNLAVRVIGKSAPRNAFAQSKVARCDRLLADHGADPVLRAAYEAKRSKEHMAAERLFDVASVEQAKQAVGDALTGLETRLDNAGPWLFGERVTMADLFWGAELIRAEDVGQAHFWAGTNLPRVAGYFRHLCTLPALRAAIIDFPAARLAAALA